MKPDPNNLFLPANQEELDERMPPPIVELRKALGAEYVFDGVQFCTIGRVLIQVKNELVPNWREVLRGLGYAPIGWSDRWQKNGPFYNWSGSWIEITFALTSPFQYIVLYDNSNED